MKMTDTAFMCRYFAAKVAEQEASATAPADEA